MGIMYNIKPCPFVERCAYATKDCSEELSGTCPVITKPEPEPAKEWDPLEPAAVTLTMEQWRTVLWKLEYYMNVSQAKAIEYADLPAHAIYAESAGQHKAEAEKVAGIIAKIELDLGWDK